MSRALIHTLLLLSLVLSLLPCTLTKPIMVVWVVRHGAREPQLPQNQLLRPYGTAFKGYRMLTNIGTRQQFILGRIFRSLYQQDFDISPSSVVIRSTAWGRTGRSGMAFVYGLTFPMQKLTSDNFEPEDEPHIPIRASRKAVRMFRSMYPRLGMVLRYPILQTATADDFLSLSHKQYVCPGTIPIYNTYEGTEKRQEYRDHALKVAKPTLRRVYGDEYKQRTTSKLQTLLYADYYGLVPPDLISDKDRQRLHEGRKFWRLQKGMQVPQITRLSCHNIFNQIFSLFNYALARDSMSPEAFADAAMDFQRRFADRDPAYVPHYNLAAQNSEAATNLRAVVYQNHDDLIFMMLRAMSDIKTSKIETHFAAALAFELHRGKMGGYYLKVRYNGEKMHLRLCDKQSGKCTISDFLDSVVPLGTLGDDRRFNGKCACEQKDS